MKLGKRCRKFLITYYYKPVKAKKIKTPKDNVVDEKFNITIIKEFIEADVYFELYLTETDLSGVNLRLTEWLIFYNFNRPPQ